MVCVCVCGGYGQVNDESWGILFVGDWEALS